MLQNATEKSKAMDGSAAFYVRIHFRQNASWQGTIQWLDEKKAVSFRSYLELTMLITEALDKAKGRESATKSLTWDNKEEVS